MDYLRKFGTMDNGVLKIDGVVESISNDGKTCTIRVPNRSGDTPVPSRYCCPSSVFAGSSPERMPTLRIRVAGSDDAALDPRHCCHAAALIGSFANSFVNSKGTGVALHECSTGISGFEVHVFSYDRKCNSYIHFLQKQKL